MKMYLVIPHVIRIDEVEVTRRTEMCVYVKTSNEGERRVLANDYFNTYDEAKRALIAREQAKDVQMSLMSPVEAAMFAVDAAKYALIYQEKFYKRR
jgi:hypothetical protein